MADTAGNDHERDDRDSGLLDLCPVLTQDITFCKQQQWSVTNYALSSSCLCSEPPSSSVWS